MAKYRKKPVVVEATQWFQNGDHPLDACKVIHKGSFFDFLSEGKVVNRFCASNTSDTCKNCGKLMFVHGWIDTKEGGHIVCPGDWVITGVQGERYSCKPDIFAATYERVEG